MKNLFWQLQIPHPGDKLLRKCHFAIQRFSVEGIVIRWILAIPFFLLFGVLAVCQIGSLMENSRNGKGTSVFPFIGGLSGVIGLAILDWKLALYWFWVPLLLDIASLPLLFLILWQLFSNVFQKKFRGTAYER